MNAATRLEFWEESVSLWYAQDYWAAMYTWQNGLEHLVRPLPLPWQENEQNEGRPGGSKYTGDDDDPKLAVFAPLYLFLAGCYLDAQEFSLAEECCRQGLQAILMASTCSEDEQEVAVRLVQELCSCWEEDRSVITHCEYARSLIEWLQQQHPHVTGNYWSDTWQRPAWIYPSLRSTAVCSRANHPAWCRRLEQYSATILDECQTLWKDSWQDLPRVGEGQHRQGAGAHDGSVVNAEGDWREVVLFGAGAQHTANVAPQTRRFLQTHCPDAGSLAEQGGGEVIISILAPHTHISPHCASTNLRWTAHLGLQIPKTGRVKIRIADQWNEWKEGQVLVFDDSYEHEVVNTSDEVRVVLLLRFWNPHLSEGQRSLAIAQALEWKTQEQERRFHPPTPP